MWNNQESKKIMYLGQIIQSNINYINYKETSKVRTNIYKLTKGLYNQISVSIKNKLRHYNKIIKSERMYAAKRLVLNKKLS